MLQQSYPNQPRSKSSVTLDSYQWTFEWTIRWPVPTVSVHSKFYVTRENIPYVLWHCSRSITDGPVFVRCELVDFRLMREEFSLDKVTAASVDASLATLLHGRLNIYYLQCHTLMFY